jgi:hypothetical protein
MNITVTVVLPDFRADVAAFASDRDLPVMYGDYEVESDDGEGMDYALLISVGHNATLSETP